MPKSPDAFRTISEVADWLGVQAHVLRFWESKFTQVKPVKRAGGRRYYRPADMLLLGGIKKLLHDDGLTIKGAQKVLRENGVDYVADMSQPLDDLTMAVIEGNVQDAALGTIDEADFEAAEALPLTDEGPSEADEGAEETDATPDAPLDEVTQKVTVAPPEVHETPSTPPAPTEPEPATPEPVTEGPAQVAAPTEPEELPEPEAVQTPDAAPPPAADPVSEVAPVKETAAPTPQMQFRRWDDVVPPAAEDAAPPSESQPLEELPIEGDGALDASAADIDTSDMAQTRPAHAEAPAEEIEPPIEPATKAAPATETPQERAPVTQDADATEAPAQTAAPDADATPAPTAKKPRIVDIPPVPDAAEIKVGPSLLSAIADAPALSEAQAREIQPWLARLTRLRDSMAASLSDAHKD